jgi:hypothetical protein
MDSPPTLSQQLRHVDQRERQRFTSTHRAEVQVVYLINEITDTAASSLEIALGDHCLRHRRAALPGGSQGVAGDCQSP